MAAPNPRLRKHLSAPGLLKTVRQSFEALPDHRSPRSPIALNDALMGGAGDVWVEVPVVAEV